MTHTLDQTSLDTFVRNMISPALRVEIADLAAIRAALVDNWILWEYGPHFASPSEQVWSDGGGVWLGLESAEMLVKLAAMQGYFDGVDHWKPRRSRVRPVSPDLIQRMLFRAERLDFIPSEPNFRVTEPKKRHDLFFAFN